MKRILLSLPALFVLLAASPGHAADPAYNAGADTIPAVARVSGEMAATSPLIVIYDNIAASPAYFYRGQAGYEAIDDLHATRAGVVTALAFQYYEPNTAAPPFSATVKVYSNPGGRDDTAYLVGGPYVVTGLTPGVHTIEMPAIEGGPVVGPDLWVGVRFSSVTAGLAINEVPAIGSSHDLYLQSGYFFYFGGHPKANFGIRVAVRKPVNAQRDLYAVDEDQVLRVDAPGVLENDAEDAGAGLVASLDVDPVHGALTFNADGSFTYTPAPDFNGVDSLIYTATRDPDITSTATVRITVNAVNDAPVARDTALAMDEDGVLAGNLLPNVYDVDGDVLAFAPTSGPGHGALDLLPGGPFTYTPAPDFNGADAFTYTASDGKAPPSAATVSITVRPVNDTPVARDTSLAVDEDGVLAGSLLPNVYDADGDALVFAPTSEPAHGALDLLPRGGFTYTPAPDFNGVDAFTYTASDGYVPSNVATVRIAVRSVNDAPVARDTSLAINEDGVLTGSLLPNVYDADGDALTFAPTSGPAHGALDLLPGGGFTYTPAPDFNGADAFTYTTSDGHVPSNVATVRIAVGSVNDTPVARDTSLAVDEDGVLAGSLLPNVYDADGDALVFAPASWPAHGALDLLPGGGFTYTPAPDFNGHDAFTYTASDGRAPSNVATVRIAVGSANDAPVARDTSLAVDEDGVLTGSLLPNVYDADGDALVFAPASGPAHGALDLLPGGGFTYTPAHDFNGADAFTYTASDGHVPSNVATVTIAVRPVNDPPVAVDDTATVGSGRVRMLNLLANDTDADADPLAVDGVTQPAHGIAAIAGDSVVVYTSQRLYVGGDSFTYTVTDGNGGFATATVNLNVIHANTPPVAVCAPATVWADDQCRGTASVNAGSYDPDGDPITIDQQPPGPYGLGATQVTLVVTDAGGEADTCRQVVTVVDHALPRIACTVSPVPKEKKKGSSELDDEEDAGDKNKKKVKYLKDTFRIDYVATDNCGPVTVSAMIDAGCLQFPIESGHVVKVKCKDKNDKNGCHVELRVDKHDVTRIEHATTAMLVVRAEDGAGNVALWQRDLCPSNRDACGDPLLAELTLRYLGALAAYVTVLDNDGVALFEGSVAPAAEFTFSAAEPGMTMGAEVQILADRNLNATLPPHCSTSITPGLIAGSFEVVNGQLLGGDGLIPLDHPIRRAEPGRSVPGDVAPLETSLAILSAPGEAAQRIGFTVPAAVPVRLAIYDVRGRLVRELVNGVQPTGRHTVVWETARVPSGVYFCRLRAGALTKRAKLLVVH